MNTKKSPPPQKSAFNWQTLMWVLLIWIAGAYLLQLFSPASGPQQLAYSEFKQMVREGKIVEITMKGDQIQGKITSGAGSSAAAARSDEGQLEAGGSRSAAAFQTMKPALPESGLMKLLEENGVVVNVKSPKRSLFWTMVISLLPWLLIIGFFVYTSRKFNRGMGAQGGPFGFGKSKARRFRPISSRTTFDHVAGLKNAKNELIEIVAYLKAPDRFQKLGGELPKGLLLVGPPGVGKTLLAQAVAGEAEVPFFSISGSEFIEMFVGVGASRVRDMFANAKKEAPSIIFVDELDSIGRTRGTGLGGGHDEREQTLNQILAEMDGFSPHESVVVLAATNRPDVLDPALVRPGRFDRRITLNLPRRNARQQILKTHLRDKPTADDLNLSNLADRTVGFSGADLKNLVNEAALRAAREEKTHIQNQDLELARDKILMGIERDDVITDEEKEMIAVHEAGHALVAERLPNADPLQKVTIIPRGGALGATEQTPEKERYNMRRQYLQDRIAILLAGRAAERIKFDDVSTGAADDLKKATQLARRMVCQWGMSDEIGPVVFQRGEPHPFLGRELAQDRDHSEYIARHIDREIRRITSGMEQRAAEVLQDNQDRLDALAKALLEKETLNRSDLDALLQNRR